MTAVRESALWIDCQGAAMLSVLSQPPEPSIAAGAGILIVVGGPQYRIGSHRQFTLLARRLAAAGFPTMRFDYRGMGDSTGDPRTFLAVEADIAAASDALRERTGVDDVVLWGLCDAASALLLCAGPKQHAAGIVLVNPWVRSADSLGATRLKHYYTTRLWSAEFWKKLFAGRIDWSNSIRSLTQSVRAVLRQASHSPGIVRPQAASFQARMAKGLRSFDKPVLLALSGRDLTAREFLDYAGRDPDWRGLLDDRRIKKVCLDEADHTFSSATWRSWLEDQTLTWLAERIRPQKPGHCHAPGEALK